VVDLAVTKHLKGVDDRESDVKLEQSVGLTRHEKLSCNDLA
jgi:hypothetical protein